MEGDLETGDRPQRTMSSRAWAVLLLIAGLCVVVPPWEETYQQPGMARASRPLGYHLLIRPPEAPDTRHHGVRIDFGRLALQWLALAALGGTLHLLRRSHSESRGRAALVTPARVAATGALVIGGLLVFPPWQETWVGEQTILEVMLAQMESQNGHGRQSSNDRTRDLGHALIKPLREVFVDVTGLPPFLGPGPQGSKDASIVRVDRRRLMILIGAVVVMTAVAAALTKTLAHGRSRTPRTGE